ncbi:unnamed protein product [Fusarium graminearum]|nr:unnamed protein product [Fusarium graminearum]CAG1976149.1 unnamed protein product [Fusarium graminearum]VTO87632.1 unnamed protein product [Fusarium graminearum]
MNRIGEDTIIAVEESDDEEGKKGSASELGSCSDLIAGAWSVKQALVTCQRTEGRTIRRVMMQGLVKYGGQLLGKNRSEEK